MKHAINELKLILDIAKNNEPIHRKEGNVAQADLCREKIVDITVAICVLEYEERQANMAQTSLEEKAAQNEDFAQPTPANLAVVPDKIGEDSEHAQYLKKPGGFVPFDTEDCEADRCGLDEPQKVYAIAAVDPSFKDGKTIYGYHINGEFRELSKRHFDKASGKTFNSWKELEAFLDDDLG